MIAYTTRDSAGTMTVHLAVWPPIFGSYKTQVLDMPVILAM